MRYAIDLDLEPGKAPRWVVHTDSGCSEGSGFDLTQALIQAGAVVQKDADYRSV